MNRRSFFLAIPALAASPLVPSRERPIYAGIDLASNDGSVAVCLLDSSLEARARYYFTMMNGIWKKAVG